MIFTNENTSIVWSLAPDTILELYIEAFANLHAAIIVYNTRLLPIYLWKFITVCNVYFEDFSILHGTNLFILLISSFGQCCLFFLKRFDKCKIKRLLKSKIYLFRTKSFMILEMYARNDQYFCNCCNFFKELWSFLQTTNYFDEF